MNLRSITCFLDPGNPLAEERLAQAGKFLAQAKDAFGEAGYSVQTTRLATLPFPQLLGGEVERLPKFAQDLEAVAFVQGIDYISLGPAGAGEAATTFDAIPATLSATQNIFLSAIVAGAEIGVSLTAVRRCASIVRLNAAASADGFVNARFAALANVPAGSAFFPAAYADRAAGLPAFSLATEAADLAVTAFADVASLDEASAGLVRSIEEHGAAITKIAKRVGRAAGVKFLGIDFSLAPFPEEARSLGTALERLGVPRVGSAGTLAAAAFVADAIDRAKFPRAGFSGLMLPVVEDSVLALRASEGGLSVTDLLLYSAVCGSGLDTLPLPGDVDESELSAILLDVAALALRLDKPLTARLMPMPGKKAGEPVTFAFPYFAGTNVLPTGSLGLKGLLARDEGFNLAAFAPRRERR